MENIINKYKNIKLYDNLLKINKNNEIDQYNKILNDFSFNNVNSNAFNNIIYETSLIKPEDINNIYDNMLLLFDKGYIKGGYKSRRKSKSKSRRKSRRKSKQSGGILTESNNKFFKTYTKTEAKKKIKQDYNQFLQKLKEKYNIEIGSELVTPVKKMYRNNLFREMCEKEDVQPSDIDPNVTSFQELFTKHKYSDIIKMLFEAQYIMSDEISEALNTRTTHGGSSKINILDLSENIIKIIKNNSTSNLWEICSDIIINDINGKLKKGGELLTREHIPECFGESSWYQDENNGEGCYVDLFTLDCIDYDDFLQTPENRCYKKSSICNFLNRMLNENQIALQTPHFENLTLPWVFQNCENTRNNLNRIINRRVRDPDRVIHPRLLMENRNRNRLQNNYLHLSVCLFILVSLVYNLIGMYGSENLIFTRDVIVSCIQILLCVIITIVLTMFILAIFIISLEEDGDTDIGQEEFDLLRDVIRLCFEGS